MQRGGACRNAAGRSLRFQGAASREEDLNRNRPRAPGKCAFQQLFTQKHKAASVPRVLLRCHLARAPPSCLFPARPPLSRGTGLGSSSASHPAASPPLAPPAPVSLPCFLSPWMPRCPPGLPEQGVVGMDGNRSTGYRESCDSPVHVAGSFAIKGSIGFRPYSKWALVWPCVRWEGRACPEEKASLITSILSGCPRRLPRCWQRISTRVALCWITPRG